MTATLPLSPKSMNLPGLLAEVRVCLVEPILSRRTEHVHAERVFECLGLVLDHGRNVEHLAGANSDNLLLVLVDPELESAFQYVRELLVLVLMPRHDAALLEGNMGEHHA